MDRRKFLSGAAAAAGTALASCVGGPNRPEKDDRPRPSWPTRVPPENDPTAVADAWGFDTVVNVAAAGADTGGETPIDDVLEPHLEAGTVLSFPPGRYRLDEGFSTAVERLGVVGQDATLVPPEGFEDTLLEFGYPTPASELFVAGLTFDFRAEDTGGRPLFARAADRVFVRDLAVVGEADVDEDLFRFDVTDARGLGVVERLSLPDGAPADTSVTGIEVGDDNRGDIDFVDCHVAGFPDNGLYADLPEGTIRVLGGTYANNGVAGVRIEAEEGVVRGVHVRCDDATDAGENMRGIRLRKGRSLLVEDCVVELLEVTTSDGAVTFASGLGAATVRNCDLRVDADGVNAIRIKSSDGRATTRGPFRCENVRITGTAAGGATIQAANRKGCIFSGLSVRQSGDSRDGILAENVVGAIRDSYISVTGDPFRFTNSRIRRSGVTVDGAPRSGDGGF